MHTAWWNQKDEICFFSIVGVTNGKLLALFYLCVHVWINITSALIPLLNTWENERAEMKEIRDSHCLPSDIMLVLMMMAMMMMRVKGKHILNISMRRSEWRKRVTNTTETVHSQKVGISYDFWWFNTLHSVHFTRKYLCYIVAVVGSLRPILYFSWYTRCT